MVEPAEKSLEVEGRVVDELRRAIATGQYAPGQRLIEGDVGADLGASRAAVRLALAALAGEGLVEKRLHKGSYVRLVSGVEAQEFTEGRMVLESFLAGRAAEKISDEADRQRLWGLLESMRESLSAGNLTSYASAERDLHVAIIEMADRPHLAEMIERLRVRSGLTRQYFLARTPGRASQVLEEHHNIIEAICRSDPEGAEGAMRAHLSEVASGISKRVAAEPRPALR